MAPREITDFTGFRTSIRQLFEVLQNAYDKEKMQEVLQNDEKFSNVDRETVEAIGTVLNLKPVLQIQGEKLDAFSKTRGKNSAKKIICRSSYHWKI